MHPLTLIELALVEDTQRQRALRRARRVYRPRADAGDTPR